MFLLLIWILFCVIKVPKCTVVHVLLLCALPFVSIRLWKDFINSLYTFSTIFTVLFIGLICLSLYFLFRNCTFETTDHEYDLSNCIWKSGEQRYLSFMYVSIAAVQGSNQSVAVASNTFSFSNLRTVDTKCKQCS